MQHKPQPWMPETFSYAAIQGEQFSNSYNGWKALTRGKADAVSYSTVDEAFQALTDGHVAFAFIPVANSIAQQVPGVLKLIRDKDVKIIDESVIQINHCVVGLPGTDLSKAHTLMSHKVALGQCAGWTSKYPNLRLTEWFDTAGAARDVAAHGDIGQVAIAPREAAQGYGLEVLAENVQDVNPNQTRFVVLSREAYEYRPDDGRKFRTAMLLQLKNSGRPAYSHAAKLTLAFEEAGHCVREEQFYLGKYMRTPHIYMEVEGRDDDRLRTVLSSNLISNAKIIGCFPEHAARL